MRQVHEVRAATIDFGTANSRSVSFAGGIRRALTLFGTIACLLLGATGVRALGIGSAIEISRPGTGGGTFRAITDLTFDSANQLYVLDGGNVTKGQKEGNFLVQKFTNGGGFVSQFSVYESALAGSNDPTRLTVAANGDVYVTQPTAGVVQQFSNNGTKIRDISIPSATAIARRVVSGVEQIVVCPGPRNQAVTSLDVIIDDGEKSGAPIALSEPIKNPLSLAFNSAGDIYILADVQQIYKFGPNGNLITVLGSGSNNPYATDGSALLYSLAVNSTGSIYAPTPHNPGDIAKFNAALTTVTERFGEFSWDDGWGYYVQPQYTPIAIDNNNRLWVGCNGSTPGNATFHFRPCVLEAAANFLDPSQPGVSVASTYGLGLTPGITTSLNNNISTSLAAVPISFNFPAANRRISAVNGAWNAYDAFKNPIASGSFTTPLTNNVAATQSVSFTPAKFGWYTVELQLSANGVALGGIGEHVGVVPPTQEALPLISATTPQGGAVDPARQAFAGLALVRCESSDGAATVQSELEQAAGYGETVIVQFPTTADCTSANVDQFVTKFKGVVKYWEVMNEPDNSMTAAAYVTLLKQVYAEIKAIDPNAQVLAPTTCGIDLNYISDCYEDGMKGHFDILSLHDYEGNETIDPNHWAWKFAQLRQILAANNDSNRPIWQTERAINGVRAGVFTGTVQAYRIALHRNIMEALGVDASHNYHFYMSEHGYPTVPSYLWSPNGPHPGALTVRTRAAMIGARTFSNTLNFGPTGNKLLMGLLYNGSAGPLVVLQSFGVGSQTVTLNVSSGSEVTVTDSFGNEEQVPVVGGQIQVTVPLLPVYITLQPGQTLTPVPIDFGTNVAPQASISYTGAALVNFNVLTNGIFESVNPSDPHTNFWNGTFANSKDQALQLTFASVRPVSKVVVYGLEADNQYCALLDFNVNYYDGAAWHVLAQVRTPCPASDLVATSDSNANTWYQGHSINVIQFPSVNAKAIQILAIRTTYGLHPDMTSEQVGTAAWGIDWNAGLMLKEVEIY